MSKPLVSSAVLISLAVMLLWSATIRECDFESSCAFDSEFQAATSTNFACSGTTSEKCTGTSCSFGWNITSTATLWQRSYRYFDATMPGAQVELASMAAGSTQKCQVFVEPTGAITLTVIGGTPATSPTQPITPDTWHEVTMECDMTQPSGSDVGRVFVDRLLVVEVLDGDNAGGIDQVRFKGVGPATNLYCDDVILDDSSDPGGSAECGTPPVSGQRIMIL